MNRTVPILIIVLSAMLFFMALAQENPAEKTVDGKELYSSSPEQIHLSWSENPQSTITIMWHTDSNSNPNIAQVGLTTNYELGNFSGYSYQSPFSGYWHVVTVRNLTPDTLYHYRVSGDSGGWSQDFTFRTAPSSPKNFTFVVCGDSRQALPYPFGNLDGWREVVSAIANDSDISFLLFTGDMCYDGTTEPYWNDWFSITQQIGAYMPIMPAIGNHETSDDEDAVHYLGSFTLPNNELWYSFNYSTAHFVVLSTEHTTNQSQLQWLEKDLSYASNDTSHPWIIVVFHKPPYTSCSEGHGPDGNAQQYFVPLFDKYHVDLVFNGHNHFYQRTYPLVGGSDPSNPTVTTWEKRRYVDPQGTIYVVTGAAGAPMIGYIPDNSSGYIAEYKGNTLHYTRITIYTNNSLHLEAVDTSGNVFDGFWIIKSPPVLEIKSSGAVIFYILLAIIISVMIGKSSTKI